MVMLWWRRSGLWMTAEACREVVVQTATVSLPYSPDSSRLTYCSYIMSDWVETNCKSCKSFVLIIRACAKCLCGKREDDAAFWQHVFDSKVLQGHFWELLALYKPWSCCVEVSFHTPENRNCMGKKFQMTR